MAKVTKKTTKKFTKLEKLILREVQEMVPPGSLFQLNDRWYLVMGVDLHSYDMGWISVGVLNVRENRKTKLELYVNLHRYEGSNLICDIDYIKNRPRVKDITFPGYQCTFYKPE